jgi:hypothetical protein
MSMHLCGPELTTTSTRKREVKVTKAQQEEIERGWRERNARLNGTIHGLALWARQKNERQVEDSGTSH